MAKKPTQLPEGTVMMLPKAHSARLMETSFSANPTFAAFYDHFRGRGMRFYPDRVKAAMYVPPAPAGAPFAVSPVLLAIVPAFIPMSLKKPSHEVASISVVCQGDRLGAIATQVTVGHDPFSLLSFSIGELDRAGNVVWNSVERSGLERVSAARLATNLGTPSFDAARQILVPNLDKANLLAIVSQVYRALITDRRVNPPYRPVAIQRLLRDTSLVEKWATMQSVRYGAVAFSGSRLARGVTAGTSCSTSCQGCTSSSTSVLPK